MIGFLHLHGRAALADAGVAKRGKAADCSATDIILHSAARKARMLSGNTA
jgi:hypothetical protein